MDPVQPINPETQPPIIGPLSNKNLAGRGLISPHNIFKAQGSGDLMHSVKVVDINNPRNTWKLIVLGTFAVIFAAAFGYSFARYLAGGFSFWFVFGALLLWGGISVLEGFLEKDISHRFLVIFLESLAVVGFFYAYAWQAIAVAAILVLFCLLWGYLSVRRELRNTIELRFFTASGKVVGKVITAAAVLMVVMYASVANANGNFFVAQNDFNAFFGWTAGFMNSFYPNLPLNGSFGDFASYVAKMQLQGDPTFQSLTPAQQGEALEQSVDQVATTFSDAPPATAVPENTSTAPAVGATSTVVIAPISSEVTATLAEPTSDVFYTYLGALTAKLQDKFGTAFIGVWALAFFLILRSIGIIVGWVAQFVALIFYEILLATGFMKISESPATKEILEY